MAKCLTEGADKGREMGHSVICFLTKGRKDRGVLGVCFVQQRQNVSVVLNHCKLY